MPLITLAFLGDVYASAGRRAVQQHLPSLREDHKPDVVVANGENAAHGLGISPDLYRKLREYGIDAVTLGDHVYREARIVPMLEDPAEPILRPANLSAKAPGKQFVRIPPTGSCTRPIYWITVLGRIFVNTPSDDPFAAVDRIIAGLPEPKPLVFVEAHMEATSEKAALAHYLDGRVTAVVGTHTHVPTADARVLPGGTAFITDVGMCGPYDSVIGRSKADVVEHMSTGKFVRFDIATDGAAMCGAIVRFNEESGRALSIERVQYE